MPTAMKRKTSSLRSRLSTTPQPKELRRFSALIEKSQILKRWVEHFRSVLNSPSIIVDTSVDRLPQVETNDDLDLPPSLPEAISAVHPLSSMKAQGSDARLQAWRPPTDGQTRNAISGDVAPRTNSPGFQGYDNRPSLQMERKLATLCGNHRDISLLSIAGKIFGRLLLNRLNGHLGRCYGKTTDMVFAAHQLQDKCQEMQTHLYTTFVDLTKAFDAMNRE
ncbi:hypothetical protein SprV_0100406100 [Sparganum proliferum]